MSGNLFYGLNAKDVFNAMLFMFVVALFFNAPEVLAQTGGPSLPQLPGQLANQNDDWMTAVGKFAYKGAGYALILIAIGASIACVWYIVGKINEIRTGRADMAALGIAVLVAAIGLTVMAIFAKYGMEILSNNRTFFGAQ